MQDAGDNSLFVTECLSEKKNLPHQKVIIKLKYN